MAKINYLKEPNPRRESDWALVAKIWPHKTKANAFSGRFGVKTKGESGELLDTFSQIVVQPGDPIMIRPNLNQRQGKKDPAFLVYMLKKSAK